MVRSLTIWLKKRCFPPFLRCADNDWPKLARQCEKGNVLDKRWYFWRNTVRQIWSKCWNEFSSATCVFSLLPLAYHHIITSAHMQWSRITRIIITRSDWTRRHEKEKKRKNNPAWLLNQSASGPQTCSSGFMHQLMAEAVVLWGERVPVPFCSTSCHWECGQQRAAWMHKYKLEGRISQSSPAHAGPHLRVSQHAAQLPSDSYVDHREPGTVISISSITGPQGEPAAGGANKGSV